MPEISSHCHVACYIIMKSFHGLVYGIYILENTTRLEYLRESSRVCVETRLKAK